MSGALPSVHPLLTNYFDWKNLLSQYFEVMVLLPEYYFEIGNPIFLIFQILFILFSKMDYEMLLSDDGGITIYDDNHILARHLPSELFLFGPNQFI